MHPTQLEILDSLRQEETRKFRELLNDVAETSDNLTYHLKRLMHAGLIESPAKGEYALAQKGIIYLNNNLELHHDLFPTLSCMLELTTTDNKTLIMKKLKQPYLGSNHLPTFGVTSDYDLWKQVQLFLDTYQITATQLTFKCNYRERVQDKEGVFIFDKLFVVFTGSLGQYSKSIKDREFLIMDRDSLVADSNTLPASKAVLELSGNPGFTETVRQSY